ncbi:MAG: hypothetical protein IH623_17885 [Verrucomicrobia bacterium]|nr:hypothetical protein [Verrucomicrobiota bacterium]
MKNHVQTNESRKSKTMRCLAWTVSLMMLGASLWAAGSTLAFAVAGETPGAQARHQWYQRCCAEVRQLISVVTYVLTPEDQSDANPARLGTGQPTLPTFDGLPSPETAGPRAVDSRTNTLSRSLPSPPGP